MFIFDTPLAQIDVAFLERLAAERVRESLTHDYKRQLPEKRDDEGKRKLLAAVASFANTAGGVLVLGFDEQKWKLPGLLEFDPDGDVRRIDEMVRANIDPPPPRLEHRILLRGTEPPVLLVGVPRSLAAPHALSLQHGGGFWGRNNRGKYPMGVTELRRAFLQLDEWEREAEEFRAVRASQALEERRTRTTSSKPYRGVLLLHVLPLGRLRARHTLPRAEDVREYFASETRGDPRLNLEGVRIESEYYPARWLQCFRHGGIEVCWEMQRLTDSITGAVSGRLMDGYIVDGCGRAFGWLDRMGVAPPFAVFLTAMDVGGLVIIGATGHVPRSDRAFDRAAVLVPGVLVAEQPAASATAVKDAIDMLWQAAGWPESWSYRPDGTLKPED